MINWKSTTTHHAARLALGLTNDEYCLLDWVYHTQGNEFYGKEGWCEIPYQDIAALIGMSKGGAFQMVDRMEKRGFIEVNPANTKRKRVTAKFSLPVYFDVKQDEEVGATIVQKVNGEQSFVQKVNYSRSESERNRSESERQIKINKDNSEVNSISKSENPKIDWMTIAQAMADHAKGDGAAQWEFMCQATGYDAEPLPIFSAWASKASDNERQTWRDHFHRVQSWMRTAAIQNLKIQNHATPNGTASGRVRNTPKARTSFSVDEFRT